MGRAGWASHKDLRTYRVTRGRDTMFVLGACWGPIVSGIPQGQFWG